MLPAGEELADPAGVVAVLEAAEALDGVADLTDLPRDQKGMSLDGPEGD